MPPPLAGGWGEGQSSYILASYHSQPQLETHNMFLDIVKCPLVGGQNCSLLRTTVLDSQFSTSLLQTFLSFTDKCFERYLLFSSIFLSYKPLLIPFWAKAADLITPLKLIFLRSPMILQ